MYFVVVLCLSLAIALFYYENIVNSQDTHCPIEEVPYNI